MPPSKSLLEHNSHPFVRSKRPSLRPDLAPARALRAGAVEDAACGIGAAGAKRPRRRRAQRYAGRRGTLSSPVSRRGYRPAKMLDHWWGVRSLQWRVRVSRDFAPRTSKSRDSSPRCRRSNSTDCIRHPRRQAPISYSRLGPHQTACSASYGSATAISPAATRRQRTAWSDASANSGGRA